MQILHKHITETGGLSIVWEDNDGWQVSGMTAQEVRKFLYQDGLISTRMDDKVLAKRRNAYGGTSLYWIDYKEFLYKKLEQRTFCEKILSTNTILK